MNDSVSIDLTEVSLVNIQLSGNDFQYSIMTQANLQLTIGHVTFCEDRHGTSNNI
ncbi:hypothetical protein I4U23_003517 [Adineta vaga]|nr:hypothetical protein I4U23_003517 [Adineta vaga]